MIKSLKVGNFSKKLLNGKLKCKVQFLKMLIKIKASNNRHTHIC